MHNKRTRLTLAIATLVFVSIACTCAIPGLTSGPSLVGTWEGTYEGSAIVFVFESSGDFAITMDGEDAGRGQYALDESTDPIAIDLHYAGEDVFTILEFTDSNTLRIENTNPGDPRPTSFSDTATFFRVVP